MNIDYTGAKFTLGAVSLSMGIAELVDTGELTLEQIQAFLERHIRGDYGHASDELAKFNDRNIESNSCVLSIYHIPGTDTEFGISSKPGWQTDILLLTEEISPVM